MISRRGITLDPQRDDYYFLITLYAENSAPVSEIYRVKIGNSYDDFKVSIANKREKRILLFVKLVLFMVNLHRHNFAEFERSSR